MSGISVHIILKAIAKLPLDQQLKQLMVRLTPTKMPERDRRELRRYFINLRLQQLKSEVGMMNQEQITMARHALGLVDECTVSYRNHYSVARGSGREYLWDELVEKGYAERAVKPGPSSVGFCLTEVGARAVLRVGERLDPEDFPQ